MKKVKEVAAELEVTRQTIYNHIEKLSPEIDEFIKQVDKAKVIEEPGIEMIRENLKVDRQADSSSDLQKTEGLRYSGAREVELLQEQIQQLKEQNEYLKEQLNKKDDQFDRFQVLLQQKENKMQLLEGEVPDQRQGLLDRIKNYFKGD